jgi:hypothetical protein
LRKRDMASLVSIFPAKNNIKWPPECFLKTGHSEPRRGEESLLIGQKTLRSPALACGASVAQSDMTKNTFYKILNGTLAKSIYFHLTLTPSPFPSPERVSGEGKRCPAGTGMG